LVKGSVLAGLAGEEGLDVANAFVSFIGSNTANCAPSDLGCNYDDFLTTVDQAGIAVIQAAVSQFAFAAQTIVDAADPLNNAASLASTGTPLFAIEVVGNCADALPDQVIPNQTSIGGFAFGGTEPLVAALGLTGVNIGNAPQDSGIVRFTAGHHASILRAAQDPSIPPSLTELAVQTEMQSEVAAFLSGIGINIFDASFILDQ
jgi:hypothetical protein